MKRFVSMLLVLCLVFHTALGEEEKETNVWKSVGGWFDQAKHDTSDWAKHAWQDISEWATQVWKDTSGWASQAWNDTSNWATRTWEDVTAWTVQAWDASSKWVAQAWADSTHWTATNWESFILWVNTVISGYPYAWVQSVVLDQGILAYDEYTALRSFLNTNPNAEQLHHEYDEILTNLSVLNKDKSILWEMLQQWADEKGLSIEQTTTLALPFLIRLRIQGENVIGSDTVFSGSIVAQYLLTVLEAMNLDSSEKATLQSKMLRASLDTLTRPTIIGDTEQNVLVTDDHTYIENFSYGEGDYQIVLVASQKDSLGMY